MRVSRISHWLRCAIVLPFIANGLGCGGGEEPKPSNPKINTDPAKQPIANQWKPYSGPGFTIEFPWGNPTERPHIGPLPEHVANVSYLQAEKWKQLPKPDTSATMTHRFGLGIVSHSQKATEQSRQAAIELLFPKLKDATSNTVMWGGKSAKEYKYEDTDQKLNQKVICRYRLLEIEQRVYVGYVLDFGELTDREIMKFFDSFQPSEKQPLPPTATKKKKL